MTRSRGAGVDRLFHVVHLGKILADLHRGGQRVRKRGATGEIVVPDRLLDPRQSFAVERAAPPHRFVHRECLVVVRHDGNVAGDPGTDRMNGSEVLVERRRSRGAVSRPGSLLRAAARLRRRARAPASVPVHCCCTREPGEDPRRAGARAAGRPRARARPRRRRPPATSPCGRSLQHREACAASRASPTSQRERRAGPARRQRSRRGSRRRRATRLGGSRTGTQRPVTPSFVSRSTSSSGALRTAAALVPST